ncbi:hypothetical protein [Chitinophaga sp. HK235]|uniref:hypothetical protein n=1 Tax=Chitinophaga sp. HK235 TaxID=2952571 RepID=UPI001BAAA053|nr:hypothetical protein [Chitinophaga sp. HK235]
MHILDKIISNRDNDKVLAYLNLSPEEIAAREIFFAAGREAGSPFDEGSITFLFDDRYGGTLPENTKYTLSYHHMFINPDNGQIFAFQWGRFTFIARAMFDEEDDPDGEIRAYGLDGEVDFSPLGDNWTWIHGYKHDLMQAYELSSRQ